LFLNLTTFYQLHVVHDVDYRGHFSIKGALEITWKKANVNYLIAKLVLNADLAGLRSVKMILSTADF
jgi:hypothetical protein